MVLGENLESGEELVPDRPEAGRVFERGAASARRLALAIIDFSAPFRFAGLNEAIVAFLLTL